MADRQIAKRHHTVPRFYLRGFADDERIDAVMLPGDKHLSQSVGQVASTNHFYTIDVPGEEPDAFEKILSDIEGTAATLFHTLARKRHPWPLESEDRSVLASFIALQAVRGPEQRRNMEHIAAQIARLEITFGGREHVGDWVLRNRGVQVSDVQAQKIWEQATAPSGPPIRMSSLAHIKQMAVLIEQIFPYILGRPWTLVTFDRRSIITSDAPVGLVASPRAEPDEGVGYLTAWGITYPINRKLGLIMGDPMVVADKIAVEDIQVGKLDCLQAGTTQLERFFNLNTVHNASQWLYHHPDDARFVPSDLPEPSPVTIGTSNWSEELTE